MGLRDGWSVLQSHSDITVFNPAPDMLGLGHSLYGIVVKSISRNKTAVTNKLMSDAWMEMASRDVQGWIPDTCSHRDMPDSALVMSGFYLASPDFSLTFKDTPHQSRRGEKRWMFNFSLSRCKVL